MVEIKEKLLVELLGDPVMAAKVLMNVDLDEFQKARLRLYWWVPEVIDSSGVSTGKTIVDFVYINLRCMLISNHVAGVYFPNFTTGKQEFWPYIAQIKEKSAFYKSQLKPTRNRDGEHLDPGAWWLEFKNGSRLIMPAPNFLNDAETQASRRFNTLVIDDWLRAVDMGDGVEKQLVDRVTRPCFNKDHPIWGNHIKFLGHAERPQHKGYTRYSGYKRAIKDGSRDHALISFCYKDWSEKFAFVRPDKVIRSQRIALPYDQFVRQWWGIWMRDGANFYPEAVLSRALRRQLIPTFGRVYPEEINLLGWDTAPGASIKSDWCAGTVLRVVELTKSLRLFEKARGMHPLDANFVHNGRAFNVSATFGHFFRNVDAPQISGFIHFLHRVFGFSRIVLDPGGGGAWVAKELRKPDQLVNGAQMKVSPICTRDEAIQSGFQPILCFFKRGSELDHAVEPQFLVSDDGFLSAFHASYRQAWESGQIQWPELAENRGAAEMRGWNEAQAWAQKALDTTFKQLCSVRQAMDGDRPLVSKRGFPLFMAIGKKDGAYSSLYAFAAFELLFMSIGAEAQAEDDACFSCV